MHWPLSPETVTDPNQPGRWDRAMRPMYWLAGARWETLKHCPPSERERIAVLGSTVLIPTIMSFLGMIFYAKSRFVDPPWISVILMSLAWAFVIMNTDRILLATYRPFQSWWRRTMQVIFRFGLAAVISVAIGFPFCLDQYRPAITFRVQTELQGKLNKLREEEAGKRGDLSVERQEIRDEAAASRKTLDEEYNTKRDGLQALLPELEKAILNPDIYADDRMDEEKKKASDPEFVAPASVETRNVLAAIEAQKETIAKTKAERDEKVNLHQRLVEAIAKEAAGQPNEFYPEPKKPGAGPRTKDMQARDRLVAADATRLSASLAGLMEAQSASDRQISAARLADRNTYLDGLASRRETFLEEAKEKERIRKDKLAKVTAEIATMEAEHPVRLKRLADQTAALEVTYGSNSKRHDETFLPVIQRIERKMNGVLDPMEETVGLYNVIFLPSPDADEKELSQQKQKWMAGLFQFLVIFGTLFVLDLVPIMTKIFSRPGPYDVLVEHPEFIANANLTAFHAEYDKHAGEWSITGMAEQHSAPDLVRSHPRNIPAPRE